MASHSSTISSLSSITEDSLLYGANEGEDLPPNLPQRQQSLDSQSIQAATGGDARHNDDVGTLASIHEETPDTRPQHADIDASSSDGSDSLRRPQNSGRTPDSQIAGRSAEENRGETTAKDRRRRSRSGGKRPRQSSRGSSKKERKGSDQTQQELSSTRQITDNNNRSEQSSSRHQRSSCTPGSRKTSKESKRKDGSSRSNSLGGSSSRRRRSAGSRRKLKNKVHNGDDASDGSKVRRKSTGSSRPKRSLSADHEDETIVEERRNDRRSTLGCSSTSSHQNHQSDSIAQFSTEEQLKEVASRKKISTRRASLADYEDERRHSRRSPVETSSNRSSSRRKRSGSSNQRSSISTSPLRDTPRDDAGSSILVEERRHSRRSSLSFPSSHSLSRKKSNGSSPRSESSTSPHRATTSEKDELYKKKLLAESRQSRRSSLGSCSSHSSSSSNSSEWSDSESESVARLACTEKSKELARRQSAGTRQKLTTSALIDTFSDKDGLSKKSEGKERRHSHRSSLESSSNHSTSRQSVSNYSQSDSVAQYATDRNRMLSQGEVEDTETEVSDNGERPGAYRVSITSTSRLAGIGSLPSSSGHTYSDENTVTGSVPSFSNSSETPQVSNSSIVPSVYTGASHGRTLVTAEFAPDRSEEIEAARERGRAEGLAQASNRETAVVVVAEPRRPKVDDGSWIIRRKKWLIFFGMCFGLLVIGGVVGYFTLIRQEESAQSGSMLVVDDASEQNGKTAAPVLDSVIKFDPPSAEDCASIANGTDVVGQADMLAQFVDMHVEISATNAEDADFLIGILRQQVQLILMPLLVGCDDLKGNIIGNGVVDSVSSNVTSTCLFQNNPLCLEVVVTVKIYLRRMDDGTAVVEIMSDLFLGDDLSDSLDLPPTVSTAGVSQIVLSSSATDIPTETPSWSPSVSSSENIFGTPSMMPTTDSPSVGIQTADPTFKPTLQQVSPTSGPSQRPTSSTVPWDKFDGESQVPSSIPTKVPTLAPSLSASLRPTSFPSGRPTTVPSRSPTSEPTANPVAPPTQEPVQSPTVTPVLSQTPAPVIPPTLAPVTPPTPAPSPMTSPPIGGSGTFCCSDNYLDCNIPGWCSEWRNRCENTCNGFWIEEGACNGIPRFGECTNNVNGCCAPATCQGDQWYKQCL